MKKIFLNQIVIIFFTCNVLFSTSVSSASLFKEDKNVIWQSGLNRYVKLVDIEKSKFGSNEHPVNLKERELKYALRALKVPDDGFFSDEEDVKNVFTTSQIQLLSNALVKGFKKAKPGQDILIALEKNETKILGLQELRFLAARLFYKEGKLNIIFGEYDFFRSKAFEAEYDPSGRGAIPYDFNFGSRGKASNIFKKQPAVNFIGIENKVQKKIRYDWFVIDVKAAARSYLAEIDKENAPKETTADKALKLEASKMAKQRREMRAEMARMRKEMEQQNNAGGASVESIEERMAILDQLLDKKLITQEEYDNKRKEILNDI